MARSKRVKRRRKKSPNWFFLFLILLFTLTFKPTVFDIETTIFLNSLLTTRETHILPSPTPLDIEKEYSQIEDFLERGELLMAKDRLDRLLARGVTGGKIHFYLGILYSRMAREYKEKALSELRMSSLYKGTEFISLYELGKLYFEDGNYKKVIELFSKIKSHYKDDPIFLKYLGISYFKLGKYEEAKEILLSASNIAPKDEEISAYLAELKRSLKPSPTPSITPQKVKSLSSLNIFELDKETLEEYFDKAREYGEKGMYGITEKINIQLFSDGGYEETIHRILIIEDPRILKEGLQFKYNKKYVSFSLYLLKGIEKDGKRLEADDFDYLKEESIFPYENAEISYDAQRPILVEYEIEIKQKSLKDKKFQIVVLPLDYPVEERDITLSIPQGISFNIYPKDKVKIKDEETHKIVYFKNVTKKPIILNNFTTWEDVIDYGKVFLPTEKEETKGVKEEAPSEIYNTYIPRLYKEINNRFPFVLFQDPNWRIPEENGNLFVVLFLADLYEKSGIKGEIGILKDSHKMGFPLLDSCIKGVIYLFNEKTYIEPFPYLPFGVLNPEDEGKKVFLVSSNKESILPFSTFEANLREDYIKFSISQLEKGEMISYTKGACDAFYRKILYVRGDLLDPKIWSFGSGLRILNIEPSDAKRLDIPFQIMAKLDLRNKVKNEILLPPYIIGYGTWNFPFKIKRRIEISFGNYIPDKMPDTFLIERRDLSYRIEFSLSPDKKKLLIDNIYIAKKPESVLSERDIERIEKNFISFK